MKTMHAWMVIGAMALAGLILAGAGCKSEAPAPEKETPAEQATPEAASEEATPAEEPGEAEEPAEEEGQAPAEGEGEAAAEEPPPPPDPRADDPDYAPLKIDLPRPQFQGTPKNIKFNEHREKPSGKPRPPFHVPKGSTNVAAGKPVTASDPEPIIGELKMVTDGDKEGTEGSYVELGPGVQWVQIDLKETYALHAILLWHFHGEGRVYYDVVVQVADDPDFIENVRTVYNNDYDNTAGLGIGSDAEYLETYEGRLIPVDGVPARYVRLHSNGSTSNEMNHYIEVEVVGKPVE